MVSKVNGVRCHLVHLHDDRLQSIDDVLNVRLLPSDVVVLDVKVGDRIALQHTDATAHGTVVRVKAGNRAVVLFDTAQEGYQTVDLNHTPYKVLHRASDEMPCALTTPSSALFAERLSRLEAGDFVLYKIPYNDALSFELRVAKLITTPSSSSDDTDAPLDPESASFQLQPHACSNPGAPAADRLYVPIYRRPDGGCGISSRHDADLHESSAAVLVDVRATALAYGPFLLTDAKLPRLLAQALSSSSSPSDDRLTGAVAKQEVESRPPAAGACRACERAATRARGRHGRHTCGRK